MSQESLKYLINGSYVMLLSLLIPSHFTIFPIENGYGFIGKIYWVFGMEISSWGDTIIWLCPPYCIRSLSTPFFYIPIISSLLIIFTLIATIILARRIKKGSSRIKSLTLLFDIIIFMQWSLIFINLFLISQYNTFSGYQYFPFFGYLLWILALVLVVKAKKAM